MPDSADETEIDQEVLDQFICAALVGLANADPRGDVGLISERANELGLATYRERCLALKR